MKEKKNRDYYLKSYLIEGRNVGRGRHVDKCIPNIALILQK